LLKTIYFDYFKRIIYININCFICLLDHEIKPEEIGMVTWADKHQLSEAKKPFMAVYLKSRNGGNIVGGPSLQKHYRRRRRKTIESSYNSNPFQSKPGYYITSGSDHPETQFFVTVLYGFIKMSVYLNQIN